MGKVTPINDGKDDGQKPGTPLSRRETFIAALGVLGTTGGLWSGLVTGEALATPDCPQPEAGEKTDVQKDPEKTAHDLIEFIKKKTPDPELDMQLLDMELLNNPSYKAVISTPIRNHGLATLGWEAANALDVAVAMDKDAQYMGMLIARDATPTIQSFALNHKRIAQLQTALSARDENEPDIAFNGEEIFYLTAEKKLAAYKQLNTMLTEKFPAVAKEYEAAAAAAKKGGMGKK